MLSSGSHLPPSWLSLVLLLPLNILEMKGTCSRRQLLFYVFLSVSFFINCHFHSQEEHEHDERKSFVLISEESEDKVSLLVGVKKFYLFRRQKRLMSSLDDYLISFSFRSNCWVVKFFFTA